MSSNLDNCIVFMLPRLSAFIEMIRLDFRYAALSISTSDLQTKFHQ